MIALMNLFKRSSGLIMVCDLARSCSPDLDVSIGRCYCATALASLTEIERRHLDAGPCAKRMRFSNVPNTPATVARHHRYTADDKRGLRMLNRSNNFSANVLYPLFPYPDIPIPRIVTELSPNALRRS